MKRRIEEVLNELPRDLLIVLKRIGAYQPDPRLPAGWFQWQVAERNLILKFANVVSGANVLEIGCGPQR